MRDPISLARQAEHPVVGLRLAEFHGSTPEQVRHWVAAHRHVQRANRRVTMAARKRRGRR